MKHTDQQILHINTEDLRGGAAKVAWRLMNWQNESIHRANMLVGYKDSRSSSVYPFYLEADRNNPDGGYLDYHFSGSNHIHEHPSFQRADVVHLHNLHGNFFNPHSLVTLSNARPTIWTLHDMHALTGHCAYAYSCDKWENGCGNCPDLNTYPAITHDRTREMWLDKKEIYEHSQLLIVTPSVWLKKMVEKSELLSRFPVELVFNGVDTRIFYPRDKRKMREKYGLPQDKFIVGSVANGGVINNARKGGYYINEVLKHFKEERPSPFFLNIGNLKSEALPYEEILWNSGYIDEEEVLAELYSAMDAFLFPSIADNCPLVISEAQACGVPIISFASGGIPDLIEHDVDGIMVPPADTNGLIVAIRMLQENVEIQRKFATNALKKARLQFSHDVISSQYERLYSDMRTRFNGSYSTSYCVNYPRVLIVRQEQSEAGFDYPGEIIVHAGEVTKEFIIDSAADVVLFSKGIMNCDSDMLKTLLIHYKNQEAVFTKVNILTRKGSRFYTGVSPIIEQVDNEIIIDTSMSDCIIFNATTAIDHIDDIRSGKSIRVRHVAGLNGSEVTMALDEFIAFKLGRTFNQLFVYGSGQHTVDLLSEIGEHNLPYTAVIDQSQISKVSEWLADPQNKVLISSIAYEEEIYSQLTKIVSRDQLIRFYGVCGL